MSSKTNYVGDGVTASDDIKSQKAITLKEITTPTALTNWGKVYTKSNNQLYFQDGAGVEHEVSVVGNHYAEMYLNNNAVATIIETANTPIALNNFVTGDVDGWTFTAGSTGAITAFADGTGKVNVTSTAHGLLTGDIISIRGTTNYNGVWQITKIDDNTFSIPDTWVVDDGASDWDEGAHLTASAGSAGEYAMSWNMSTAEGGAAGSHVTIRIYINTTADIKGVARRKYANNDQGCTSGNSMITIADGDKVYITAESSGVNDITNQYGNLSLRRR